MKIKNQKTTVISALGFGFAQRFTPDSVTIEEPGSSITHTRQQVEGWLDGMNIAKLSSNENACRKAVEETMKHRTSNARRPAAALALTALLALMSTHGAFGSEIIRGYAPQDGQQLYAADLDNLIDESTIGVQFYNDQQTTPVLGAGYYFLILNPANQTYYRINAQQVLYGNTNIFLNAPPEPVPAYGLMLFCDPSNNWVASTTVSNFLWNSASNINVAGLSFANSNNAGATMQFVLPRWPYPLSGLNTNYPVHFLIFDTNGIPYREGLSNLEANMAYDFGTDFGLPWDYRQEFEPWQLYGTNAVAPYTNIFGYSTNFPVTSLFATNIGGTATYPTLTDTDTVPVNAWNQGPNGVGPTNTSATLLSLYEYLTNKTALPPYTMARCVFSGIYKEAGSPVSSTVGITNMDTITGIITNVPDAVNWSNPAPVSFYNNGVTFHTVPTVGSNTLYWAEVTNWPNLAFQLYTNYANALARTNPITGNGVSPGEYWPLLWLTNYTSVNCAVIQDEIPGLSPAIEPGMFSCFFITPSATPFYYMTGSAEWPASSAFDAVTLAYQNYSGYQMVTTNGFSFITNVGGGTAAECPLVNLMVFPQ